MAATATAADGKEPGELREASVDSLQESLKNKRMKIEKDRSVEEKRKSADVRSNFGSGSRSSSTPLPSSEYTQVRLIEGKEDISRGMVRSSPQWEEKASFLEVNEESRQGYAETCNRSNDMTFTGENPLLYAVTNQGLEKQDAFQSSGRFKSARETSPTQFVVKNGDLQENDVLQSSKSSTCSDKASKSPSLRKDAPRPSKSSRASGETSPLIPPLHVRNHAMEKEDDAQASKPSRWSKEISPIMDKPSSFQAENHISNKDGFKGSKVSRWSEKELAREEKVSPCHTINQELKTKHEFQALKASRWSEASPSAEKPLSLHLKNQNLQKKDDVCASKASRLSVETSPNHKKQSSSHAKDQELLTKAYVGVSKPSRWSEMAFPNDKRLSSRLEDQHMQNKDDRKPSKPSRWSEETSPNEENISSSHVQNHFMQKRSDLVTVKVSRWSEETSPREEKQLSFGVKQAGHEALKTSRWLEEASPSEEKTFLFGIVDEDLKKRDVSEVKSGRLTNDDVRDQPNENAKIKSELGEGNGGIGPVHSTKNNSFALESQIKSSRWEEEDSPYGERASLFHVKNQEMHEKDDVETRSEHEIDDKEGINFDDSESDDHTKTETDLGEISGVNEREDNLVEDRGYQKASDMISSIQGRDKGSHDANEDEEGTCFLPEEIDSRDCKIDMLKSCRSVEEFEMVKKINEGTYGVVYKAKDKKTGEIMALKKVKMEKERDGFPMTSLREINILLSIKHPCIVNVKEVVVGNSMDSIYMVMEYMEHDLKRFMGTLANPFSQSEVKWLMLKLFEGIKHLHDNWVLHRDLKTSNILLNNDGELKICDFGMARQYGSPLITYTSLVVTLWYRSPELLLGCKEYSTAVDMWSLGCIMGELLSKEPLFSGKNEVDQLDKIFRTLGTPDETVWPDFPNLPGVKCSFVKQRFNRLREKFPPTAFAGGVTLSNKGFDLLSRLLMYDPKKRITSEDALNHEWFREFPLPKMPELSSSKRAGASPWR